MRIALILFMSVQSEDKSQDRKLPRVPDNPLGMSVKRDASEYEIIEIKKASKTYPIKRTIDADQKITPRRNRFSNLGLHLEKLNAVCASLCHTFSEGAGIISTLHASDSCINESFAPVFVYCQ